MKHTLSMLRSRALLVALSALTVATIGCGKKKDGLATTTEAGGTPVNGDWVIIREISDPSSLNLVTATDATSQEIHGYIYETLLYTDPNTLENIPWVADTLPKASDDHMSYEVRLKKNVKFSDGKPVTGEDYIFFLKSIKNPEVPEALPQAVYVEDIDRAELIDGDPYHIRFIMRKPYFLAGDVIGGLYALPKHVWDPTGISDKISFADLNNGNKAGNKAITDMATIIKDVKKKFAKEYMIGSGPYMFESFNRNDRVVLARNPNYWNQAHQYGKNYPDKIVYRTITDENSAFTTLKNGDVDVMPSMEKVNFKSIDNKMDEYGLKPAVYDYPAYTYIGYNEDKPLFKDKLVRNALARAIDRKSILDKIYFGYARAVQSPIFYKRPDADTTLPIIPFNLEEARKMLTDAGWSDSNGDGILDKNIDGQQVDFKFTILLNQGNQARKQIAVLFADALKKIGVQASTSELEWATFSDRTRDGDFDAFIGGWVMGVTEGDLYQIWHSESAKVGGSNYVRFRNPTVDSLILAVRAEFDPLKRRGLVKEIQRVIHEEQPYNFLVSTKQTGAYSARFQNVSFFAPRPCYNLGWWWVPQTAQKYGKTKTVAMN